MTGRRLRNIGASVRARLLERSRKTGERFEFLLQRYGAERFLYRLGESVYRERFVLKGAMLLAFWGEALYRPTRDLDLAGYGSPLSEDLRPTLREICVVAVVDDGIVFNGDSVVITPIRTNDDYEARRARFEATLDGARIRVQIDIGFGDAVRPSPIDVEYPVLLDAPHPRIRAYPRESVVAEKIHAMVAHGERNSRYKDFYDLHVLAQHFDFDGEYLVHAVGATFEQRRTPVSEALPVALTPSFYADAGHAERWVRYRNRNDLPAVPSDFGTVGDRVRPFLVEPWEALARGEKFTAKWPAGGPWQH